MAKKKTIADQGYTVLARRYRPQQFSEIVGQQAVATALENAINSNRVAHAYLFTGARGVGKTSTARILAKALNCEKGPTLTPCGTCEICQSIASGEDVDVLEIDGASNNGVEKVREIRSNVQYRPSRARFKIYIIDEVHMLTTAAFNALLKTLEEPPPHVKFFFATTEAQKIPITILSRCQRFDFNGIPLTQIQVRLKEIVKKEKMKADEEALELIARRASGSMRDAQSLLDQLLAFGKDTLTTDQVHSLLGMAGDDRIVDLASAVLAQQSAEALDILSSLAEKGLQYGELVDQLLNYWRDLMVVHSAEEKATDLSVPSRHRETLQQQAQSLSLDTILAGLDILNTTRMRLKNSNHGRLLVEMALVRLGRLGDLVSLSQLAHFVSKVNVQGSSTATKPGTRRVSPPEQVKKKHPEPLSNGNGNGKVALNAESLEQLWSRLSTQIGPLLASNLSRANSPAISGPNTLVLRFPNDYNYEYEFCQEPNHVKKVEEALQKLTGEKVQVRMELSVNPSENAQRKEQPKQETPRENPLARTRLIREEAEGLPLIKRAMDVLGAEVKRVDEGFNSKPEDSLDSPSTEESDIQEEEES